MLFLNQPLILPLLYHKSVTTCQIDSYKVSNSMLQLGLCNCVITEIVESTAPPQQQHKRAQLFSDHAQEETYNVHSPNVCCFCVKSSVSTILTFNDCAWYFAVLCFPVIKHNTAKHHAQSVKVKMMPTQDLTQKQHTFGECALDVSYCACSYIHF